MHALLHAVARCPSSVDTHTARGYTITDLKYRVIVNSILATRIINGYKNVAIARLAIRIHALDAV